MKTLKLGLLAVAATLMIGTSCKKYEEGPSFSLRTKKARIVNTWTIEKTVVDGTEYTRSEEERNNNTFEIKKDGTFTSTSSDGNGGSTSVSGTWEFGDKKESIKTTFTFGGVSTTTESTIILLKNSEWATQDDDGDKVYYIAK